MKNKGNDGTGNTTERDLWQTEQSFWESLDQLYDFKFDCCANYINSKTPIFSDDFESIGIIESVAWMNPPFTKAKRMFEHFFKVVKSGVAIYRIDNPETKVWQDIIFPNASWVFIPSGRVSYTPFDITIRGGMTRFPSALIGLNVPYPIGIKGVTLKTSK